MWRRWLIILISICLCTGCSTVHMVPKPSASIQEQQQDQLECQKIARDGSWTIFPGNNNMWLMDRLERECLEKRGWVREPS